MQFDGRYCGPCDLDVPELHGFALHMKHEVWRGSQKEWVRFGEFESLEDAQKEAVRLGAIKGSEFRIVEFHYKELK